MDDDPFEYKFDESSCICNHMPEDHGLEGCGESDCPCEARWE